MKNLQTWGAVAAWIHAAAYVVGLVVGVTLIFPVLGGDPVRYIAFVANNQAIVYLWNLVSYWVSAITVVLMALALYDRLKARSPALMQAATVFGLIWAALIIASANLMLRDVGVVAALYIKDPAQATAVWLALDAVETGIVSGNELVGSLWVLLLSLAALRTAGLSRVLNYLGLALGAAGTLTLIPALAGAPIFGLGMIGWSVGLGIVIWRNRASAAA